MGLVASAPLLSGSLRAETRRRAEIELASIAELKATQLDHWRADQLRIVRFGSEYPAVRQAVEDAERGRADPAHATHLREVLEHLGGLQDFERVSLYSESRAYVGGWARSDRPDAPPSQALVEAALNASDGAASELRLEAPGTPYLEVAVALLSGGGRLFVLVARADATRVFQEVLERWPVPAATAAGSLAFQTGDGITLLVPERAPTPRIRVEVIPLHDARRPIAQAFDGATGLLEGEDMAGTPIFVASRPVAGTAWRVQAKIAVSEIEAPLGRPLRIIYALEGALLSAAAVMLALSWRQQRARALLDARLREAQERLALAVSGTHSIWDWDLARGVLALDPPTDGAAGPPLWEVSGGVEEIVARVAHADDAPAFRAAIEAHLRGEVPLVDSEHRLPPGERGPSWIRVRGRVIRRGPAGEPLRFAAVVSDVTERRKMQAQLELSQRMAGLGTLAAGVAHEINNPLASVSGNLEYLASRVQGDAELAEALAEARDGAERIRDVVRGLRAFSSPATRERAPADVRAELEAAIRLARNEVRHRARLEVRIGDLPLVEAATHELGQVFLNLLLNAAQAIPEGRAEENVIEVTAGRSGDGAASIRIRDTGVGIPPHILERIFEPFFTTKPLGVGTGLGLAIAHRIVVDAGGRIDVETQLGRGTTFGVVLPAARGAAAPTPHAPDPTPVPVPAGPLRVLVVDDDPLVVRAVTRCLGTRFAVTTAASAPDALARIQAGARFDAVVCDLMMPQMTGMELHARVVAHDPGLARRMIFMTGGAFTEAAARFVAESRAPCLDKPFEPDHLRAAVERAATA